MTVCRTRCLLSTAIIRYQQQPRREGANRIHRGHAIIEQTIAELKNGPLAHLASGQFAASHAGPVCAVTAFNLVRAAAHPA